MVVLVEAVALEGDAYSAEHLVDWTGARIGDAGGQGVVGERLAHFELDPAGLAAVLVGRHGRDLGWSAGRVLKRDSAAYRRPSGTLLVWTSPPALVRGLSWCWPTSWAPSRRPTW